MAAASFAEESTSAKAAGTCLRAAFFALGFLLYFAPLGAAAALPVCTALAIWLAWALGCLAFWRDLPGLAAYFPLLGFMALSSIWAIDAQSSLWLAARLAVLLGCAIILARTLQGLPARHRWRLLRCLGFGLAASSALTVLDLSTGAHLAIALHHLTDPAYGPNTYSRGSVFQAIIIGPVVAGLWLGGRRHLAASALIIAVIAILLGSQWSAKLALFVAAACFTAVMLAPILRWLIPALLLLAAAALPFLFPKQLPGNLHCWLADHKPSALHRSYIWNFVETRIHEKPFFGWGLDAARNMPGGQSLVPIRACSAPPGTPAIMGQLLPLHPHNGILQIWLELGGVGACLFFGTVALVLYRALRASSEGGRLGLAMRSATAASILSVAAFSFGVWQEWWLSCVALAVAATALAGSNPAAKAQGRNASPLGLAEPEAGSD